MYPYDLDSTTAALVRYENEQEKISLMTIEPRKIEIDYEKKKLVDEATINPDDDDLLEAIRTSNKGKTIDDLNAFSDFMAIPEVENVYSMEVKDMIHFCVVGMRWRKLIKLKLEEAFEDKAYHIAKDIANECN